MNNQEGMLAAVSALGGRGASRPLRPSTPLPWVHATPGHSLHQWTWPSKASGPGRASRHRRSHAGLLSAKPAAAEPNQSRHGGGMETCLRMHQGWGWSAADSAVPSAALDRHSSVPALGTGWCSTHRHQSIFPPRARPPALAAPRKGCDEMPSGPDAGVSLTAPSHCCCGWAGSGSPPGTPGEEGDVSARGHRLAPPNIPPMLASSPAQLRAQTDSLLSCCHWTGSPGAPTAAAGAGAAAGAPPGQQPGALAACPGLTRRAEYRAELHKVSAE